MYAFVNRKQCVNVPKLLIKFNCNHYHHYHNASQHRKYFHTTSSFAVNKSCPNRDNTFNTRSLSPLNRPSSYSVQNYEYLNNSGSLLCRYFHSSVPVYSDKPSSKVEETVQALKDKAEKAKSNSVSTAETKPVVKKSIKQKVVDELVHYYHGFRLLFIDIRVSIQLAWRILNGNQLTRREHNLLVRTVSDMFRLVPFSVFIIVPFMEFLLPVFIKLFPGLLPTTFQTDSDKEKKLKQSLKVKIEMAKFLQETLDNMTVKARGHSSKDAKDFVEFFGKVRSEGGMCTSEEIMKFSKLFEDEITLDSLPRPQLVALCRVLEIQPIGTSNFLRFQLRMKIRSLVADDQVIQKEGLDALSVTELHQACRARGMRAYGLSTDRLKFQLSQWLDLSLNKKVPPSLLLLSRAFMLPETIPTTDKLKATISALPETVAVNTKAILGEREGKIDNLTKIEIIKEEQRRIKEEREESIMEKQVIEELEEKERLRKDAELLVNKASVLVDKAIDMEPTVLKDSAKTTMEQIDSVKKKLEGEGVSPEDISNLEDAVNILADKKHDLLMEKDDIEELKEELADYKEDVDDLQEVLKASDTSQQLKESKAAKRLFKTVNKLISKMDEVVDKLQDKETQIKQNIQEELEQKAVDADKEEVLRIDELIEAIRKIQKVPDESKLERIGDVLSKIDEDHDGSVRIDTVVKVLEMIGKENSNLSTKQIEEIVELLEKEEALELDMEKGADKNGNDECKTDPSMKANSDKTKLPKSIFDSTGKSIPPTEEVFSDTTKNISKPNKL